MHRFYNTALHFTSLKRMETPDLSFKEQLLTSQF